MSLKTSRFHHNRLYSLIGQSSIYTNEILIELHQILHEQPDLSELIDNHHGSFFHLVVLFRHDPENIAFRIIYALSNAGGDPNVTNNKGNTPLHELLQRDSTEIQFDLVQALIRVGVDLRIKNNEGKRAEFYVKNNPQLTELLKGYGRGIWSAIQSNDIGETKRLIHGFIKVDAKHNTNKTLLDKANDFKCSTIIEILAENQVTIEFLHSILAADWKRAELIYQYQQPFVKVNAFDSIHRFTWFRTQNRSCSKSLAEFCFETNSNEPWRILHQSSKFTLNVNVLCTDGFPLFFHCFHRSIPIDVREMMIKHANMYTKSTTGQTFLFHLIHLYCQEENENYLQLFQTILYNSPLILTERDENHRTIIEELQLTSSTIYLRLRKFYQIVTTLIIRKLNDYSMIEQMIYNRFGFYLLMIIRNQHLPMIKDVYQVISLLKVRQGLHQWICEFFQSIIDDRLDKFEEILKKKPNIYQCKDPAGRTSAHLAVLHQRFDILKFICENYPTLINARDHLYRTSFHYACILNDQRSIELLEEFDAKDFHDCYQITAREYLQHRDICTDEFNARDCSTDLSLNRSNFVQMFFYSRLKEIIINDQIEQMKLIHREMIEIGFDLNDFPNYSYQQNFILGERYVPLFFLTIQHRSTSIIQYFIQNGLSPNGRLYLTDDERQNQFQWIPNRLNDEEKSWIDLNELIEMMDLENFFRIDSFAVNILPVENVQTTDRFSQTAMNLLMIQRLNNVRKSSMCILM